MAAFSRYIVYADESGSPNLEADTKHFPIFVLTFLVVEKSAYSRRIVPEVAEFKFKHFGHDQVVLHESDIRKQRGPFAFLRTNATLRETFLSEIASLAARRDIALECAIVDKTRMPHSQMPWSPYDIALGICMDFLDLADRPAIGILERTHLIKGDKVGDPVIAAGCAISLELGHRCKVTTGQWLCPEIEIVCFLCVSEANPAQ